MPPSPLSLNTAARPAWPDLPYGAWKEFCARLRLWTRIVGKIRLVQSPWLNHSWHAPHFLSVRGLTTSPIPCGAHADFLQSAHEAAANPGGWNRPALERPLPHDRP